MNKEWLATVEQALAQIGSFSQEHIRLFNQTVQPRFVEKDTILLAQGAICQTIYWGVEGAFCQVAQEDDQEPTIIDLHTRGQWIFNQQSLVTQTPSLHTIQAYSTGIVLELPLRAVHQLIEQSPVFLQLGRLMLQATDRIYFFDQHLTPAQKYQYILDAHPQLISIYPLKMIAAYLKMTPETLSRIRERMSRGIS